MYVYIYIFFSLSPQIARVLKRQAYLVAPSVVFVPVKADNWQRRDDSLQLISF